MSTPLADRHANCFDLLRLIMAAFVVYTHAFLLSRAGPEPTFVFVKQQIIFGELGVLGFFGLSGYLVTASWERSTNVVTFLWNRTLRIFPGFLMCLLVTAGVIGPAIAYTRGGSIAGYPWFGSDSATMYFLTNSVLMVQQWSIGGILETAPYTESLNGSLWSIAPEFMCYLLTVGFGLTAALRRNSVLFLLALAFLGLMHYQHAMLHWTWEPHHGPSFLLLGRGPRFMLAYLVGAALWVFRTHWQPGLREAIGLAVCLALVLKFGGAVLAAPVLLPILLIALGQCFRCPLKWDLSYGLYLYHFPVMQLLATSDWCRSQIWIFLPLAVLVTTIAAVVSWTLIERPILSWKRRRES